MKGFHSDKVLNHFSVAFYLCNDANIWNRFVQFLDIMIIHEYPARCDKKVVYFILSMTTRQEEYQILLFLGVSNILERYVLS